MKVNSHNKWDKLREVIAGKAEGQACLNFSTAQPPSEEVMDKAQALARKAYPQWLVDEIAEDLEGLCDVLSSSGVKVLRPDSSHVNRPFATPYFSGAGDHIYNMHDLHLVAGTLSSSHLPRKNIDTSKPWGYTASGTSTSKKGFAGSADPSRGWTAST